MSLIATHLARPPILAPMSFAVAPGEVVGLVGPNGAGKTTLLRALAGLTSGPGEVSVSGVALPSLSRADRPRRIAYMPAVRRVDWPMAARDVVALGLPTMDHEAIERALTICDALPFADRRVDRLSTGERARVLLARAIVARPAYLLLDEPTANVDPFYRLAILEAIRAEANRGAGVVISLHDLPLTERTCDRLLLLDGGALVADGTPEAVLTDARLAAVFRVARGPEGWRRA